MVTQPVLNKLSGSQNKRGRPESEKDMLCGETEVGEAGRRVQWVGSEGGEHCAYVENCLKQI